jgi:hypothetical protein
MTYGKYCRKKIANLKPVLLDEGAVPCFDKIRSPSLWLFDPPNVLERGQA